MIGCRIVRYSGGSPIFPAGCRSQFFHELPDNSGNPDESGGKRLRRLRLCMYRLAHAFNGCPLIQAHSGMAGQHRGRIRQADRAGNDALAIRQMPKAIRGDADDLFAQTTSATSMPKSLSRTRGNHAIRGRRTADVPTDCATRCRTRTGALQNARHRANADDYLAFLATKVAQDAYASFGFVKAAGGAGAQADRLKAAGATMSQSEANGCRSRMSERLLLAVAGRAPHVPFRPADAQAPITLDSRWPRQCHVRCDCHRSCEASGAPMTAVIYNSTVRPRPIRPMSGGKAVLGFGPIHQRGIARTVVCRRGAGFFRIDARIVRAFRREPVDLAEFSDCLDRPSERLSASTRRAGACWLTTSDRTLPGYLARTLLRQQDPA